MNTEYTTCETDYNQKLKYVINHVIK